MSKSLETLLKNVNDLMSKKGLRQTDLAKALGMSKQAVNQFLTGKHAPRLGTLDEIADGLEVPAFYLLMSPEERETWDRAQKSGSPNIETVSHLPDVWQEINKLKAQVANISSDTGKSPVNTSKRAGKSSEK